METALRAKMMGDVALAALVGTRIDWTVRPERSALPAVVLQLISDPRPQHMQGFQSYRETRVQVDVFALTRASVVAIREAVIAAVTPAETISGTNFLRAFVDNVIDRGTNSDTGFVHSDLIDFRIWHN